MADQDEEISAGERYNFILMVSRHVNLHSLITFLAVLLLLTASATVSAQLPPKDFENLKVLSPEIGHRQLIDLMKSYSRALGVRCEHCHVGTAGAPLAEFDFVSDQKPPKNTARLMIRMTRDINQRYLEDLGPNALEVSCLTCHHGQPRPQTLEQLLTTTLEEKGLAETLATYRRLRKEFQDGDSFDFRAESLNRLARDLASAGKLTEAQALLELNLEQDPDAAATHFLLGELHLKRGERSQAAARYRQTLKLDPEHASARLRLEDLAGQ